MDVIILSLSLRPTHFYYSMKYWRYWWHIFIFNKGFYILIGYSFYGIVLFRLSPFRRGIPLPGRGIVGKNKSSRSKTTVRSKGVFPFRSAGGPTVMIVLVLSCICIKYNWIDNKLNFKLQTELKLEYQRPSLKIVAFKWICTKFQQLKCYCFYEKYRWQHFKFFDLIPHN